MLRLSIAESAPMPSLADGGEATIAIYEDGALVPP